MRATPLLIALIVLLVVAGLPGPVQAAAPATWSRVGDLIRPRSGITAALLPDGQVLVVGNAVGAERYDPRTEQWRLATQPPTNHLPWTLTPLENGLVLMITTFGRDLYDPATDRWTALGLAVTTRAEFTATRLSDGRVLSVGGQYAQVLDSTEIFDPADRTSRSGPPLGAPRTNHTATLLHDGSLLVVGGYAHPAALHSMTERLDPLTFRWRESGLIAQPRLSHTATLLPDGRVLVVGGWYDGQALASVERYDPITDTWTTTRPLPAGRWGHTATLLPNGQVLVVGGTDGRAPTALRSAWLYTPERDEWRELAPAPSNHAFHTTILLRTGQVLITGGLSDPRHATDRSALFEANGLPATGPLATSWSFAAGDTRPGSDDYLALLNPHPTPAELTLTFWRQGAPPLVRRLRVPASTRTTVAVHDEQQGVGRNGGQGWEVALQVTSTNGVGIVAERVRYGAAQGTQPASATSLLGAPAPQPRWYFAEGFTGAGFSSTLTIFNPSTTPVEAQLTFYRAGAEPLIRSRLVGGQDRAVLRLEDEAEGVGRNGGAGWAVATVVATTDGRGIIVERTSIFRYGTGITGGQATRGVAAPGLSWYLAAGASGAGSDTYLALLNPAPVPARVRLTFYQTAGAPVVRTRTLAAASRATVAVHDPVTGVGRVGAVAVQVESLNGIGVVVERATYDQGGGLSGPVQGGEVGGAAPHRRSSWYLAEGYTGSGFSEEVAILNPNPGAVTVTLRVYRRDGPPLQRTATLPGRRRSTLSVPRLPGDGGAGGIVAVHLISRGGDIVVERTSSGRYAGGGPERHGTVGYAP